MCLLRKHLRYPTKHRLYFCSSLPLQHELHYSIWELFTLGAILRENVITNAVKGNMYFQMVLVDQAHPGTQSASLLALRPKRGNGVEKEQADHSRIIYHSRGPQML